MRLQEGLRLAQLPVQAQGQAGQGQTHQDGCGGLTARAAAGSGGNGLIAGFFQHAPLQVRACGFMLRGVQRARIAFCVQLRQLSAQDGQAGLARRRGRRVAGSRGAQQRWQHQRQGQEGECHSGQPEHGHLAAFRCTGAS